MRISLVLALALAAAGCGSELPTASPPTDLPPSGSFPIGPFEVGSAEITVAESQPPQVFLHVRGGGNPCLRVGPVQQFRSGHVIDVRLESYSIAQFCIQVFVTVEHTTTLQGPFEPGEYLVRANGVEVRFKI
jgi:hypothetical protein